MLGLPEQRPGEVFAAAPTYLLHRAGSPDQVIAQVIANLGPIADAAWAASANFARRCYLGDGPGTASDGPTSGLPPEFEGVEPDDTQIIPARANFAVLLIEIAEIDWLYLAHTGHQRAQFSRVGEEWTGRWVAP